jgi:hypothetical protein
MRNANWKFYKAIKILCIAAIAITAFGFITQQLWDWLMPPIFNLHPITFPQALGLLILSKILLGFPGGRGGGWRRDHLKEGMRERWEHMSPEDRERFRAGMRGRRNWCSDWPKQQPADQSAEPKGI